MIIKGVKPHKLVFRDGVSQSQRLVNAPNPDAVNIEDRTLKDFLEFAAGFGRYLNFYNTNNKADGDWQGFLNGGLSTPAEQKKWLEGLLNYAEAPDKVNPFQSGTPYSSPHLALFVTFLKLIDKIKVQLNDFSRKHLDLYYNELLSISKKQSVPHVVNIVAQLTSDIEQLLIPKGTQLSAGKDNEGKDLVYQTTKDTYISRAEVKNIKSLFVDKRIIGLREKRKNYFDQLQGLKEIINMALGYDNFDPKRADAAAALKYLLKDAELEFVVKSAGLIGSPVEIEWERIYDILESGYRRQLLRNRVQAGALTPTLFGLLLIAFGDSDGHLPEFGDNRVDEELLIKLYQDAIGNTADKKLAAAYITGKLLLSVKDFDELAKTLNQKTIADARWREIYILLETASAKRKDLSLAVPQETEWKDIIAINDVKATANSDTGHFKTFGKTGTVAGKIPATLGLAISSSRLLMREGKREISVYIAFNRIDNHRTAQLAKVINERSELPPPFIFYVSTAKGWKILTEKELAFGNFLRPVADDRPALDVALNNDRLTSPNSVFTPDDKDGYVIMKDGNAYLIEAVIDAKTARVSAQAKIPVQPSVKKYGRNELLLNALHVKFHLNESDPEIVAPNGDDETVKVIHTEPVLAFMLNDELQSDGSSGFNTWYQKFHELTIANVAIDVEVSNIKRLSIQNSYGDVDPKKPFAPFGNEPVAGSRLEFSHPEIAAKAINKLTLTLEWMNMPTSLPQYYAGYRKVYDDDMGGLNLKIEGNDKFIAGLTMIDHRLPTPQSDITLFNKDNAATAQIQTVKVNWRPGDATDIKEQDLNTDNDVSDWTRYFTLEFKNHFKQAVYPALIARQAMSTVATIKEAMINPPLVPVLKQFSAGYQTDIIIDGAGTANNTGSIFHIMPFGYAKASNNNFMPPLENEGELYIGFNSLGKQQNLSLLFQLAVGSANPDLPTPAINWSYLNQNRWVSFTHQQLLSDTTNGMVQSGLAEFFIPAGLNSTNTLIGDNLYWLRATVNSSSAAIPDLIDLMAQGAEAIFVNQDNAADHLMQPLEKNSIKSTVSLLPGIKNIAQPFESTGGKPAEDDACFYTRISERLRHKNRALTMWDYERMVLEEFPELYKVKCLPGDLSNTMQDNIGGVDVIVIPRIQGWFSFDSFQPKLPADALLRIRDYLEARIPPFATVTVKNPTYMQLRVRTAVRIKQGYPEAYSIEKLEDELKRFLAPWAYDKQAEIVIGGKVHHNVIVNFIAQRPYIDHVNTIKLLQSRDGITFHDVLDNNIANVVSIVDPNVVMVSAPTHELRLLTEEEYTDYITDGIGYMAVGVDFKINPSDQVTT